MGKAGLKSSTVLRYTAKAGSSPECWCDRILRHESPKVKGVGERGRGLGGGVEFRGEAPSSPTALNDRC